MLTNAENPLHFKCMLCQQRCVHVQRSCVLWARAILPRRLSLTEIVIDALIFSSTTLGPLRPDTAGRPATWCANSTAFSRFSACRCDGPAIGLPRAKPPFSRDSAAWQGFR